MATKTKSLTLARLEDLTLGAFAFVPESPVLNRLVSIVATAGGKEFSCMFFYGMMDLLTL